MQNIAILIGNTKYSNSTNLPCCADDVEAVSKLLSATGKYSDIINFIDSDVNVVKEYLHKFEVPEDGIGEIFFYFTGHGVQNNGKFYYCFKDYESDRPNETSLSASLVLDFLRRANADLVVQLIDACNSGNTLIKSGDSFLPLHKDGLDNYIQISSCLEDQNSLTGEPISLFTNSFINASLNRASGEVYYSHIMDVLKDEYISDNSHTPHFISQGTLRFLFVDDAEKLKSFKSEFLSVVDKKEPVETVSSLELFKMSEAKYANYDKVDVTIKGVLGELEKKISEANLCDDYFDIEIKKSSTFASGNAKPYITRVMSKQGTDDNLVTASVNRVYEGGTNLVGSIFNNKPYKDEYHLKLNSNFEVIQVEFSFIPKFSSLKKISLVFSCAPSLRKVFLFEYTVKHPRQDFDTFSYDGDKQISVWYKLDWDESYDWVLDKVMSNTLKVLTEHVSAVELSLSEDSNNND